MHVLPVGRDDDEHQQADGQRDPRRVRDERKAAGRQHQQHFLRGVGDGRQRVTGEHRQRDLLRQQGVPEPLALHRPADEQPFDGLERHRHARMLGPVNATCISL